MRSVNLPCFATLAFFLAACAGLAVTPTPTPAAPTAVASPPAATLAPDDVISATPAPPGLEQPQPPDPYAPQPGDEKLARGQVFIDSTQLLVAESFPPQFFLSLEGSLPTPCHQLRITTSARPADHRIVVDAYSLADPNAVCAQVLQPFNVGVPLGSLPAGKYEVWLNGQPVGEIEAP